jgi:hypothetical protein
MTQTRKEALIELRDKVRAGLPKSEFPWSRKKKEGGGD